MAVVDVDSLAEAATPFPAAEDGVFPVAHAATPAVGVATLGGGGSYYRGGGGGSYYRGGGGYYRGGGGYYRGGHGYYGGGYYGGPALSFGFYGAPYAYGYADPYYYDPGYAYPAAPAPNPGYYDNSGSYNDPGYYNNQSPGYPNSTPNNCNPPGAYDQNGNYQYYPGCQVNPNYPN